METQNSCSLLPFGLSSWIAQDLRQDQRWIHRLSEGEAASLAALGDATCSQQPELMETVSKIIEELWNGRGIFLLRGLHVDEIAREKFAEYCMSFTSLLGELVEQDMTGNLVRWVEDQKICPKDAQVYGHRGHLAMEPHTDSAEFLGLFCVRPAKTGGATIVTSAESVFKKILRDAPDHLSSLQSGFYFDTIGQTNTGISDSKLPIFTVDKGRVVCQFNKRRIEAGSNRNELCLSSREKAAIDYVNQVAKHPDLALRFYLEPGDVLFLSNRRVLHARDEFEDSAVHDQKRLLLRLWFKPRGRNA